jgi:hypothetical protein
MNKKSLRSSYRTSLSSLPGRESDQLYAHLVLSFKNVWSYKSISLYTFVACRGISSCTYAASKFHLFFR